jgi:hypothetical protein
MGDVGQSEFHGKQLDPVLSRQTTSGEGREAAPPLHMIDRFARALRVAGTPTVYA